MKKKNKSEEAPIVREEMTSYQHRTDKIGVTRMISQTVLDEECMTITESKGRILEKIHNQFNK